MRWAHAKCRFNVTGDKVKIVGPYFDDPGRTRTVTVNVVDFEAYANGTKRYVQDAFPYLSSDDREFLISGMSPEGWEETFGKDE